MANMDQQQIMETLSKLYDYDIKTNNYENFKESMIEFLILKELDQVKEIVFNFSPEVVSFAERFIADIPSISEDEIEKEESDKSVTCIFNYNPKRKVVFVLYKENAKQPRPITILLF